MKARVKLQNKVVRSITHTMYVYTYCSYVYINAIISIYNIKGSKDITGDLPRIRGVGEAVEHFRSTQQK